MVTPGLLYLTLAYFAFGLPGNDCVPVLSLQVNSLLVFTAISRMASVAGPKACSRPTRPSGRSRPYRRPSSRTSKVLPPPFPPPGATWPDQGLNPPPQDSWTLPHPAGQAQMAVQGLPWVLPHGPSSTFLGSRMIKSDPGRCYLL